MVCYLSLAKQAAMKSKEDSSFSSSNNLQKDSNKSYNEEEYTSTDTQKGESEKSELSELSQETTCHHATTPSECAVCSGYVRWLLKDEDQLRAAQANPGKARREFWRAVRGGVA